MKFLAQAVLFVAAASSSRQQQGVSASPTDRPYVRMPAYDEDSSVLFCPKPVLGGVSEFEVCTEKEIDCPAERPNCKDEAPPSRASTTTNDDNNGRRRKLQKKTQKNKTSRRLTHAERWEQYVNRKNAEYDADVKKNPDRRKLQSVGPTFPAEGARILPDPEGPVLSLKATVGDATDVLFHLQFPAPHDDQVAILKGTVVAGQAVAMTSGLYDPDGDPAWTWWVTDATTNEQIGVKRTFFFGPEDPSVPQTRTSLEDDIEFKNGNSGGGSSSTFEGPYLGGGQIQEAIGRIYYKIGGQDYACSGTAIHDNKTGRSIVLSAAHCVYDQATGLFATDVIFIPNRDMNTALDGENVARECDEDPCGCWRLSGGLIDWQYAGSWFPYTMNYDYGFFVVNDVGKHQGTKCRSSQALDVAVLESTFTVGDSIPLLGEPTADFGYTLMYNPDLRFCEGTITTQDLYTLDAQGFIADIDTTLWNDNCGLNDGASGGPWTTNFDYTNGEGPIVTVNSYSFTGHPGMGAPYFWATNVRCLMNRARDIDIAALEASGGEFVDCVWRACIAPGTRRLKGDTRPECTSEEQADRK